jgi:DNA end-binding protein Ku
MAKQLVSSLTGDFDPDQYRDEYREELLALIERKAKGEAVVQAETEEPKPTKAPDLMAALEESLAAVKGEPLGGGGKKSTRKKPAKSRAKSSRSKASSNGRKSSSKSKSSSRSGGAKKSRSKSAAKSR